MTTHVDFWFEFASTYSYLSAMRIEEEASKRGVVVHWRPFLLGPIFAAQGWNTSPFKIYEAKGRYMWRDMARRAERLGLVFKAPAEDAVDRFPQNGLAAARLTLAGLHEGWGQAFARAVYKAEWAEGADISDAQTLARLVAAAGGDPTAAATRMQSPEIKSALRANTDDAIARGVFGAPSFTVGEELFWGDDRLEDALDWASA